MRFTQQRAPFVQSLREKSDALMEERDRVVKELEDCQQRINAMKSVTLLSFISPEVANKLQRRTKQAEDEPRCQELRTENAALTAKLVSTKEVQKEIAGSCEKLKIQKNDLLQRKVSSP
jgi:kinetochore protein Nuf2